MLIKERAHASLSKTNRINTGQTVFVRIVLESPTTLAWPTLSFVHTTKNCSIIFAFGWIILPILSPCTRLSAYLKQPNDRGWPIMEIYLPVLGWLWFRSCTCIETVTLELIVFWRIINRKTGTIHLSGVLMRRCYTHAGSGLADFRFTIFRIKNEQAFNKYRVLSTHGKKVRDFSINYCASFTGCY